MSEPLKARHSLAMLGLCLTLASMLQVKAATPQASSKATTSKKNKTAELAKKAVKSKFVA